MTWKQEVGICIQDLPRDFTTYESYRWMEQILEKKHPENNNVRAKIRQVLQQLRDDGVLKQGRKKGQWVRI